MRSTGKFLTKFTFSNHQLAYKVRGNMLQALTPYDDNQNGLFQEQDIVRALVDILDQNENQIKYVISNVFRYDKDGDRAVTYQEFVNFAVEQHFGEMSIQRLHRNQVYSRGKQRLMNLNEFQITLNQSLQHIQATGSRQQYQLLFSEVDLDKDGWIKYEQFFLFLRQYFGSMSQAATQISVPLKAQPIVRPYVASIDYPAQRFARLIYSQLKVLIMQQDIQQNLFLTKNQISQILLKVFSIPSTQIQSFILAILRSKSQLDYQSFMKIIIPIYYCQYDVQKNSVTTVNQDQFVSNIKQASSFVRVQPNQIILREIFRIADTNRNGILQKPHYIDTLGSILENYQFDNRGTTNHYAS